MKKLKRLEKYRSITNFPTLYKIFTGVLTKRIQKYMDSKNSYNGMKDQLLINKITENSRKALKKLRMTWVDH